MKRAYAADGSRVKRHPGKSHGILPGQLVRSFRSPLASERLAFKGGRMALPIRLSGGRGGSEGSEGSEGAGGGAGGERLQAYGDYESELLARHGPCRELPAGHPHRPEQ